MTSTARLSPAKASYTTTATLKKESRFNLSWTLLLASVAIFLIHPFITLLFSQQPTSSTLQSESLNSMSSIARTISRGVAKKVRSIETAEGAGAVVRRSIGTPALRNISPFLMLDHFRIGEGAGFPDHPHRGQTTITYILDGQSQHEDFAGHAGTIGPGDVQWMNAGHGIMHAEMPVHRDEAGNKLPDPVGLQLWVDLPKQAKKEPPSYQEYRAAQIPTAESKTNDENEQAEKGWKIKVVAGESHGVKSPIELPKNGGVLFLDIHLEPSGSVYQTIDPRYNAFIYTLEGSIVVGDHSASTSTSAEGEKLAFNPSTAATPGEVVEAYHTLVLTKDGEKGVRITNASSDKKARMVVVAGEPLDQEVFQYGPFVMTTRQEIQQTLIDFQTGSNGFERAPGWRSKIGAGMM
ncbi:related to Pirin [Ustilago trichophora]|uniref:Related to Pirin n=1 Tax=Ustilago trichophora TaxID=86804 RepID=A0A5C3EB81_9BASI|nr:related to Pirin [Ustilago trichophora]